LKEHWAGKPQPIMHECGLCSSILSHGLLELHRNHFMPLCRYYIEPIMKVADADTDYT